MGYHRRHLSLFDYLILGYVADRTVRDTEYSRLS